MLSQVARRWVSKGSREGSATEAGDLGLPNSHKHEGCLGGLGGPQSQVRSFAGLFSAVRFKYSDSGGGRACPAPAQPAWPGPEISPLPPSSDMETGGEARLPVLSFADDSSSVRGP